MARGRTMEAFTRRDLLAVVVVLFVLGLILPPAMQRYNVKSQRIACVGNLKVLGTAYRIWSNDNGDRFPSAVPMTNGGWSDLLTSAEPSAYVWTNYVLMDNDLGHNPLTLICPSDERKPAKAIGNLANTNISYFMGVVVNDTYPQSLLGGDRNLGSGTTPDPEHGFSPANGRGNDVVINGPVCWSLKMHSRGNPAGAGNILLGDGSAQQATSGGMNGFWLKAENAQKSARDQSTNSPQVRLIFP